MTTLGFHKNDYKILESDQIEENSETEDENDFLQIDNLEKEDLALDILFILQDHSEEMSVPLFDKCKLDDIISFLFNE